MKKIRLLGPAISLSALVLAVLAACIAFSQFVWRFPDRRTCGAVQFSFHKAMWNKDIEFAKSLAIPALVNSIDAWGRIHQASSCTLLGGENWSAVQDQSHLSCLSPYYESTFIISLQPDSNNLCTVYAWSNKGVVRTR